MNQTVDGILRNGKVELLEEPRDVREARVIVTFLPDVPLCSESSAPSPDEIADLHGKLAAWQEDWNAPGMEAYNDYETRRCGISPVPPQ